MSYAEAVRIEADAIPVIDLAGLADGSALERVGRAMLRRRRGWGSSTSATTAFPLG
jgi:hypothetical protein